MISPYIRAKMRERHENGATIHEIVKEFQVSPRSVYRACCLHQSSPKPRGRPRILSPSDLRRLCSKARENATKSAKVLRDMQQLTCSVRTVQRALKKKGFTKVHIRKTPKIPETSVGKRLAFAKEHLPKGTSFWSRVIFSDEKKWNLQGNDGYVSIWKEKTGKYTFETDLRRRPGVMVWGAICENGARYIQRITGKITADAYQRLLEEEIFDGNTANLPLDFIFQQDNAPAHAAHSTRDFFIRKDIPVLEWPPYSPDLNIIENLWAIVSQKVYEGGREYQTADELWESVSRHFLAISDETITALFQSMPRRLISVVELGGKRTSY